MNAPINFRDQPRLVLRQCADRIEAETVRIRLAADDITAFISGTDSATALGMGGAATNRLVRVEVAESDYQRASQLLLEDEAAAREAGPWVCGRCHEPNESTFQVCWSCSKPRSEDDRTGTCDDSLHVVDTGDDRYLMDDANPYRPVVLSSRRHVVQGEAEERLEERIRRAFNASVVGVIIFFPPIVTLCSLYLLLSMGETVGISERARRRLWLAWAINLVMLPVSITFAMNLW